jgi:uncharacterized membrane protein YhaH (DUF805 family)
MGRLLLRLYPRRWRERYGTELLELFEDVGWSWRDAADAAHVAAAMRWNELHGGTAVTASAPRPTGGGISAPQAVFAAFRNYASFDGRASRAEAWWFLLFTLIVPIMAALIMFGLGFPRPLMIPAAAVVAVFGVAVFVPLLAVAVRRVHDTGRSGWWLLLVLIPHGIGPVIGLTLLALPGTAGPNEYGPPPEGHVGIVTRPSAA